MKKPPHPMLASRADWLPCVDFASPSNLLTLPKHQTKILGEIVLLSSMHPSASLGAVHFTCSYSGLCHEVIIQTYFYTEFGSLASLTSALQHLLEIHR